MGLVGVSGGSIRLEGNELVGIPEDRLKALRPKYQIVFQDPYSSLNPRMRVGKIVQDPLNLMDLGSHEEREEREKEVFEQIGLHQAQRALFPHQFSGGQRQRISIGRALASYPELIICDEPVSALDVAIQAQILNLFMDLQEKNNLTYLFISHDLGVVQHMCDDIGVMYLGRFAEVADKVSLFTSPAHPYTYSLLSVVPQVSRSPKGGRVKLLGDPRAPSISSPAVGSIPAVPLPRTSAAMRSRNSGRSGTTISWPAIWSGTGSARISGAGSGRSDGGPRRNRDCA